MPENRSSVSLFALVLFGCTATPTADFYDCTNRARVNYRLRASEIQTNCPLNVPWQECPGASDLDAAFWSELEACK